MADSEDKAGAAVVDHRAEKNKRAEGGAPTRSPRGPSAPAPSSRQASHSPLRVYKPGQGPYVRWSSAVGAGVIAGAGVYFVNEQLALFNLAAQTLLVTRAIVATALIVVSFVLIFWVIGRSRGVVDFMIATEGEMKKVNWSSRKEVFGATRVVIVMVLGLGLILFCVNLLFIIL